MDFFLRAKKASEALHACADSAERTKFLGGSGEVWRSTKTCLASLSYGKCWYCETLDSRSDNAVDHFRPKGRLAEDENHGGYWWLAFNPENFRFSCTYCNSRRIDLEGGTSGGKQDRFPISDETGRARQPSDPLAAEWPLLLDPCSAYDVSLVWYDETGQVRENAAAIKLHPEDARRIAESTEAFHWNHGYLVGARRRKFTRAMQICERADTYLERVHAGDASAITEYRAAFQEITTMCGPSAEYSRAARCAVTGYAQTSPTARLVTQSW